jgi:hypothetical protein
MANYKLIESTMYGFKKAKIYQNEKTKRFKIMFYTLKDSFLFTSYYKNIPSYIVGKTI